jgi:pyocin large subunit-like protein
MSLSALTGALRAKIKRSSDKFILVCMANYADEDDECWLSQTRLQSDTSLDRKTIMCGIRRLVEAGYIRDTGERKGSTKQIIVWRLVLSSNPTVPKTAPLHEAESVPESGPLVDPKSAENGTIGTVPETAPLDIKGSRFSHQRVPIFPSKGPKNGLRNLKEPIDNQRERASRSRAKAARTPIPDDWWPSDKGVEFAKAHGVGQTEVTKFIAHHQANGKTMADWSAAWRTWCMNDQKFRQQRPGGSSYGRTSVKQEIRMEGFF